MFCLFFFLLTFLLSSLIPSTIVTCNAETYLKCIISCFLITLNVLLAADLSRLSYYTSLYRCVISFSLSSLFLLLAKIISYSLHTLINLCSLLSITLNVSLAAEVSASLSLSLFYSSSILMFDICLSVIVMLVDFFFNLKRFHWLPDQFSCQIVMQIRSVVFDCRNRQSIRRASLTTSLRPKSLSFRSHTQFSLAPTLGTWLDGQTQRTER